MTNSIDPIHRKSFFCRPGPRRLIVLTINKQSKQCLSSVAGPENKQTNKQQYDSVFKYHRRFKLYRGCNLFLPDTLFASACLLEGIFWGTCSTFVSNSENIKPFLSFPSMPDKPKSTPCECYAH